MRLLVVLQQFILDVSNCNLPARMTIQMIVSRFRGDRSCCLIKIIQQNDPGTMQLCPNNTCC